MQDPVGGGAPGKPLSKDEVLERVWNSTALSAEEKEGFQRLVYALSEADGEFRNGNFPRSLFCWRWHALGAVRNTLVCCSDSVKWNLEWFLENLPADQRGVLKDALRPKTEHRPVMNVQSLVDGGRWPQIVDAVRDLTGREEIEGNGGSA